MLQIHLDLFKIYPFQALFIAKISIGFAGLRTESFYVAVCVEENSSGDAIRGVDW